MTGLPTGTVTFLFTDIEGSTLLERVDDRQYADVLSEHSRKGLCTTMRLGFATHEVDREKT